MIPGYSQFFVVAINYYTSTFYPIKSIAKPTKRHCACTKLSISDGRLEQGLLDKGHGTRYTLTHIQPSYSTFLNPRSFINSSCLKLSRKWINYDNIF